MPNASDLNGPYSIDRVTVEPHGKQVIRRGCIIVQCQTYRNAETLANLINLFSAAEVDLPAPPPPKGPLETVQCPDCKGEGCIVCGGWGTLTTERHDKKADNLIQESGDAGRNRDGAPEALG